MIVLTGSSKTHTAVRKDLAYYLRNLAHAIVVRSIANIEYFIVNRFKNSRIYCVLQISLDVSASSRSNLNSLALWISNPEHRSVTGSPIVLPAV